MTYDVYSAFGNNVRVKLLLCLAQKPKNVTELISTCGLSQSAVSQHLSKLRASGLVSAVREGKTVTYSLKYKKAADVSRLLQSLQQEVL
jgi:DNA-binding transcriptional ArsR family regulator